jgi:hypothetical protein
MSLRRLRDRWSAGSYFATECTQAVLVDAVLADPKLKAQLGNLGAVIASPDRPGLYWLGWIATAALALSIVC